MGMHLSSRVGVQGPIPRRRGSSLEAKQLAEEQVEYEDDGETTDEETARALQNEISLPSAFSSRGLNIPAGSNIVQTRARVRRVESTGQLDSHSKSHELGQSTFPDRRSTAIIASRINEHRGSESGSTHWSKHPFLIKDQGLFKALAGAGIQPNPTITPQELIIQVAAKCGPDLPHYPHLDYFVIRMLFRSVAKNSISELWKARDVDANSLLMLATHQRSEELVSFMLEKHARDIDLNERNKYGQTALHVALTGIKKKYDQNHDVSFYFIEIVLRHGAHVDVVDDTLNTPLHYAAVSGDSASLAILLMYGADVSLTDSRGFMALDYATQQGHSQCVALLLNQEQYGLKRLNSKIQITEETKHDNALSGLNHAAGRSNMGTTVSAILHAISRNEEEPNRNEKKPNRNPDPDSLRASLHAQEAEKVFGKPGKIDEIGAATATTNSATLLEKFRYISWREGARKAAIAREKRSRANVLFAASTYKEMIRKQSMVTHKEIKGLEARLTSAASNHGLTESRMKSLETTLEKERNERKGALAELTKTRSRLQSVQIERNEESEIKTKMYGKLAMKMQTMEDSMKEYLDQNQVLLERYVKERKLRRKVHNENMDLRGAIRVVCRIRPLLPFELERGNMDAVVTPDTLSEGVVVLSGWEGGSMGATPTTTKNRSAQNVPATSSTNPRGAGASTKSFELDYVLGAQSTQSDVFDLVEPMVQSAVDGFNVCLFAYGQTGSGKTHTMVGGLEEQGDIEEWDDLGVAPQSFRFLFETLKEQKESVITTLRYHACELYNNQLIDLLNNSMDLFNQPQLNARRDKDGIVFIENITERHITSLDDLLQSFRDSIRNRKNAATQMNVQSSRSHLICSVIIECTDKTLNTHTTGKLTLIDLAGAERLDRSGVEGQQMLEAVSINKSLTALGDVISALTEPGTGKKHIPYRNNLLTQVMSDSLGGNAKTMMIVNVSPAKDNLAETNNSLTYATRARNVRNKSAKGVESETVVALKREIKALRNGKVSTIV